jgi:hypothetical protein
MDSGFKDVLLVGIHDAFKLVCELGGGGATVGER